MSSVQELIRTEADGSISFGDYHLDKKAKDSERKRREREKARTAETALPPTAGTPALPEPAKKTTAQEAKYGPEFEEFWKTYPKERRIGKGDAYKKYRARRNDGYSSEELRAAAEAYAAECRNLHTEKQYIKHPKTFLSDALPFVDYLPKNRESTRPAEGNNPFAEWGDGNG